MSNLERRNFSPEYEMLQTGFQTTGRELLKIWRKDKLAVVQKESIHSIVTEADLTSQTILVNWIKQLYPKSEILSEESNNSVKGSDFWIIDPLDGTSHFERGLEGWSISGARVVNGEVVSGVTYAPIANEFFYAEKGKGAFVNGVRLCVSDTEALKDSTINAGHRTVRIDQEGKVKLLLQNTRTMWTTGSTALVLANLAAGRLDIALQEEQSFWDIAAGTLLIREAGGKFTNRQGSEEFDMSGKRTHQNDIVVTNGILHDAVLEYLNK